MTFLTEALNSKDCKILFSDQKKLTKIENEKQEIQISSSSSTRYLLYGIITCLGLLILLLVTAIAAPYVTSFSFTASQERSVAEIASDEIIIYELEKLAKELQQKAESLREEIHELENQKPKVPVVLDDSLCYLVPNEQRFDCFPEGNASQSTCETRGCCWSAPSTQAGRRDSKITEVPLNVPYCFYPFDYPSYHLVEYQETANGFTGLLERDCSAVDVYPAPVQLLRLEVHFETTERLHVKITDSANSRFEVPLPMMPEPPTAKPAATLYDFNVTTNPFSFQITRKNTETVIFDTSAGGFAFYDQFIEVASYLPSRYIYGLGEHTDAHFLHSVEWTKFTFWATDTGPAETTPLYGDHPFYLSMEEDGRANGVLLFNSNAMDVILQPAPAITYRTIGGVLDFYFFLGPSPKDVVAQYVELIGKPALPPYWALGYHLCRYGYGSLAETIRITQRNIAAGIPLDTQWNDIDYMNHYKDFTVNLTSYAGIPAFVEDLHNRGMHYVVITDPGISSVEPAGSYPPFDHGVALNCFVKNVSGEIIEGKVWTGKNQAYPDFTHPNATAYWTREIADFREIVPTDGLWIDMNEPSNFVDGSVYGCPNTSSLEFPPYFPQLLGASLSTRTLCMTAKHYQGLHYNLHSTYGIFEALVTRNAFTTLLPNKRPFVLSRSSFVGQGKYSAHWTGDIGSNWFYLQTSIGDILNFNIFGISFVGADICGFEGNTTPELCLRWHQVGAFYPFSRNHNSLGNIDQDPASFSPDIVDGIRKVLNIRYKILPFFNSLFFRASLNGSTVVRALFFEFPNDREALSIDGQFLVGSSLLVSPVVTENTTEILAYFPKNRWFDFYSGVEVDGQGAWIRLDSPMDHVNLHVRGGHIIPMQKPNTTTTASRLNPMELLIALDEENSAFGELFWDDGEQLDVLEKGNYTLVEFSLKQNILTSVVVNSGFQIVPLLDAIVVFGMEKEPTAVIVQTQSVEFTYTDGVLRVESLDLNLMNVFEISFQF